MKPDRTPPIPDDVLDACFAPAPPFGWYTPQRWTARWRARLSSADTPAQVRQWVLLGLADLQTLDAPNGTDCQPVA